MEEASFDITVRDFRATDLTTRNRFRDKLRVVGDLDGKKFKSKKELIGGGDVTWKFKWNHEYKIFAHSWLEQKELTIKLMLSKSECYGTIKVDLYTIATGPVEHNLPVLDINGKSVGRLNFFVEMNQVSNIAVLFKEVKLRHLKPQNKECNPYLKYAYSRQWPLVVEGKMRACYSAVQYNTTDPKWSDLPEMRFHGSIKEILQESIVLHVTHHGKMTNTTLGRCNLLFRTLVDNGKTFKDEDLISFRGPLKVENAEIEGLLVFKFLPRFAQMKAVSVVHKAIHTENGIFDAVPLIPGLPVPKIPVILSDKSPQEDDKKKKKKNKDRESKEEPVKSSRTSMPVSEDVIGTENDDKNDKLFPHHEDSPSAPRKKNTAPRKPLTISESSSVQRDLMSFSPIATRKAKTTEPAPQMKEIKEFEDFSDHFDFGAHQEPVSTNPFRPLSLSMPNLPVEPVPTTAVVSVPTSTDVATTDLTHSLGHMALTQSEPVVGPKHINHPTAAGNYPTSYPVQYSTGPVVIPHPYAPTAVLATVVGPVSMAQPGYNPFMQMQPNVPVFNPFTEATPALMQQPANPFVVIQ